MRFILKDEELEKAAEETKDLTEQDLRDIADVMERHDMNTVWMNRS